MDLQVQHVAAKDCHVRLPYSLVQALSVDFPPAPLFLELRAAGALSRSLVKEPALQEEASAEQRWFLSWMGEMARSDCLEVPSALGKCINLSNGSMVRVRVRLPEEVVAASSVELEPSGPDDWELLETNQEYLEKSIPSQVSVLHEGQRIAIWVRQQSFIVLQVLRCSPQKVVRLVNGSELSVTPKERSANPSHPESVAATVWPMEKGIPTIPLEDLNHRREANAQRVHSSDAGGGGRNGEKRTAEEARSKGRFIANLRVQEVHPSLSKHMFIGENIHAVAMPSCIYLSPITACQIKLSHCQLVSISAPSQRHQGGHQGAPTPTSTEPASASNIQESSTGIGGTLTPWTSHSPIVVQVRLWGGVAQGHAMVGPTLRLQAGLHLLGQVKLHVCHCVPGKVPSSFILSPLHFKGEQGAGFEKGADIAESKTEGRGKSSALSWGFHRDVLTAARTCTGNMEEGELESGKRWGEGALLASWLESQSGREDEELGGGAPLHNGMVLHVKVLRRKRTSPDFKSKTMGEDLGNQQVQMRQSEHEQDNWKKVRESGGEICQDTDKGADTYFLVSFGADQSDVSQATGETSRRQSEQKPRLEPNDSITAASYCNLATVSAALAAGNVKVKLGKAVLGHLAVPVERNEQNIDDHMARPTLSWLRPTAESIKVRLQAVLSEPARQMRLLVGTPRPGGVLLTGAQTAEKKKLALAVAQELRRDPTCQAFPVYIKCAELVGEPLKDVRKTVERQVGEALEHAPAIIILDDVDALLPAESEGDGGMGRAAVLLYLADIIDYCQSEICPPVAFLGVAQSTASLAHELQVSGRLDCNIELPAPLEHDRLTIISSVLEERNMICLQEVLASVAGRCQGFDITDMEVLVDRAVHAGAARLLKKLSVKTREREGQGDNTELRGTLELLEDDFRKAEDGFVPAAMRGIVNAGKASKDEKKGWQDVGGLRDVRKALEEILDMPAKHSKLFAGAPLRLRTGVLLYGPPGCGKTHIVGAAASACGVRCVSVKGPELLNKYIGASEQAVRDVFAKASLAAPCILFFDEFDAIAPKRGHDNTGVTDRVVNQLLTELDGVEGLTGVFVIAATSRPDLIDAALLRPGRLDRLLLCDFPTQRERVEILESLARHLPMAPDVDLKEVGLLTNGFSGADLQALLADAQLTAVHAILEAEERNGDTEGPQTEAGGQGGNQKLRSSDLQAPLITAPLLRQAAAAARASVPQSERTRLGAIYENFVSSKSAGAAKDVKGKRATLA